MYGTWKRLNAVAVSVKAKKTHTAPTIGPSDGGTAKVRAKNSGQRERADQHEPAARAVPGEIAVGERADDRVDDDVPDLRDRDDDAGDDRRDAERVGEVVGEHEARQGREAAGAERTGRVAGDRAA